MADRPHILILMPDQLRADCLSCAGHGVVRTPNMDRLADQGTRFDGAYTASPVCMPARSSFLAGLFCHNHGQWGNRGHLPADADTCAGRLRAAGYRTCHVGKSHLHPHIKGDHLERQKPFLNALGFDDVFEITGPHATVTTNSIVTDRWEKLGCLKTFRDDYARRAAQGVAALWPSPLPPGETLDDFVGRTATEYVESYNRDEPMMLFVGFAGPHEPWDPPADWAARYADTPMNPPEPVTAPAAWVSPIAAGHQRKLQKARSEVTPEIVARTRALYYAKISHIDDWMGRILNTLQQRRMLDDTVVILWSDHGEMLWDKGRTNKEVFYEQSVHIPLIIRTPQSASDGGGKVAGGLVSLVDLFPTILDLALCKPKPNAFGQSLAPMLADQHAVVNEAVFSEIDNRTMIRDDRFKMVINDLGEVLKLYDMVDDPREEVNLAGKGGTEDVVRRLREQLFRWLLATPNRQ